MGLSFGSGGSGQIDPGCGHDSFETMIRCRPRIQLSPPPSGIRAGDDDTPPGLAACQPFGHPDVTAPLTVITCHFNWQGYERPRQHLHRFLRQMQALQVPVYGVEAVLPGQVPQTQTMSGWCQVVADQQRQILFQKEALLNLAEKLLPDHVDKIAFIDADVWMSNPHWVRETALLLDHFPMVQPFGQALWTGREGAIIRQAESVASRRQIIATGAHPGFGMAARRELWRSCGGLYPWMILGGGDMAIAAAALNLKPVQENIGLCTAVTFAADSELFAPWYEAVARWTGGRIASTPGDCVHEWHGERKHRAYAQRHELLPGLISNRHLRIASNGLIEWTEEAPDSFIKAAQDYFARRREDG